MSDLDPNRDRGLPPLEWLQTGTTGSLPRAPREYPDLFEELSSRSSIGRELNRHPVSPNLELSIFPTLGAFCTGYLLVAPSRSTNSFAEISPGELTTTGQAIELWRVLLSQIAGDVIIGEHGSSAMSCESAACISQAHLHLIPMPGLKDEMRARYFEAGGEPAARITTLAELPSVVGDRAYIMLSANPNEYEIWLEVERFPRQFVRRQAAALLGIGSYYNWRVHPFVEQMELAVTLLRGFFSQRSEQARGMPPLVTWSTEYDYPERYKPEDNPHFVLFGEENVEKLIFFAGVRARGLAEEAVDQLARLYRRQPFSESQIARARAVAMGILRSPFDLCTQRAAFDLLRDLGENPPWDPYRYIDDD